MSLPKNYQERNPYSAFNFWEEGRYGEDDVYGRHNYDPSLLRDMPQIREFPDHHKLRRATSLLLI